MNVLPTMGGGATLCVEESYMLVPRYDDWDQG